MIQAPSSLKPHPGELPISLATIIFCQLNDIRYQTVLISSALRHLVLREPVLPNYVAGPTLRKAKLLPHVFNAPPTM